jgi:putative ABC transport system substrate-binding protein
MGLGLVAGCGRLPGQVQAPLRMPRIGVIMATSTEINALALDAFQQGLRDLGYVEGQNILVEYRTADGQNERYPGLVAELITLPVDLIFTATTPAAVAARQASSTLPVVLAVGDPVGTGLATSLARPGGNVTGLTTIAEPLSGKRLQLLADVVPGLARVGILWNGGNSSKASDLQGTQDAAIALGMQLVHLEVRSGEDLDAAFAVASRERADGLVILEDGLLAGLASRVANLAASTRLPAMYDFRPSVVAGGLMGYGPSIPENCRRAATYVDKILKGAKPADLPIEQPMRFEFVINLKTAQALGLTIPQHVLLQATELIR